MYTYKSKYSKNDQHKSFNKYATPTKKLKKKQNKKKQSRIKLKRNPTSNETGKKNE